MKSISWFLSFSVLLFLDSCTIQRTFQNSGALNTISIELADDNVNYERLNSEFNRMTFGGFLVGASSHNVVEANVITNNNGEKQASAVGAFGANMLSVLTLASTSAAIYSVVDQELSGEVKRDFNAAAALAGLGFGFILNEAYWRSFNRRRITAEAVRNTMQQNPDADFYSFPYSELEVQPELFGTKWKGKYRIVAGNVSDDVFGTGKALTSIGNETDEKAIGVQPQTVTNNSTSDAKKSINEPTVRGKVITVGSTGEFAYSKNRIDKFTVVEIMNFKGGDDFRIRVVCMDSYGQYGTTMKASNKKLTFD